MRRMLEYAISPAPSDVELRRWNTPVAFMYGGLAILIGVIAVALLLLACSCGKSSEPEGDEKKENRPDDFQPAMEPRVAVIMAGEANPTYLAKPVAISRCEKETA